jgi:glucosamine--fructose-6-phosphate aminotransferase (isomerizing)
MVSNIEQIKARRGRLVALATEGDGEVAKRADFAIAIPPVEDCFAPAVAVVPLQLFAYSTAVSHGLDPDKPRNLAKTVTVE